MITTSTPHGITLHLDEWELAEVWDAHNGSCCERCHRVRPANCPFDAEDGLHDYPSPTAFRMGLVEPVKEAIWQPKQSE